MATTKIRTVSGIKRNVPRGEDPTFTVEHEPGERIVGIKVDRAFQYNPDRKTDDWQFRVFIAER